MPDRGVTAQPGMVPTAPRTAGTMFAALYGDLVPHAWHDPESGHDAYQLFHQRSLAMGWLDDRSAGGGGEDHMFRAPGLWAMNDAGWCHPLTSPGGELVSWFQVEVGPVAGDRPLPVQPFLKCAEDTTARVGRLLLSAVQVLLPVQGLDASSRPPNATVPSMETIHWFAERDPRSTPVEVSVNSGRDPSAPAIAGQLIDDLSHLDQDVFRLGSHDIAGRDDISLPPFDDSFWNGPPLLHAVVLRGDLGEWTCDAIGWLAETVADSVAHLGVRSPLLITVKRTLSP